MAAVRARKQRTRSSRPAARRPVLLTVSGSIPHDLDRQVADGRRPRADYRVIAEVTGADVVDVEAARRASGVVGRALHRLGGPGTLLAWFAFRRRRQYEVLFTDGEQVGIPLALLTRVFGKGGCSHVMIVHILSVPKKVYLMRAARLPRQIDRYITYCTSQANYIRSQLGVPGERVVRSTFMVDTEFFAPAQARAPRAPRAPHRRVISSAGLERRDYPTMMEAVDGLDVDVVIAAASPWSRQSDSSAGRALPGNVRTARLDQHELRELYSESALVVVPLVEIDFQAGITTILEAMSMERAVICTRTSGQTDTIIDGSTGVYVPPGDAVALRAAIRRLLDDPAEVERLGGNARQWVVEHADVWAYAGVLKSVVAAVSGR
jgi:glycosyltransferase involved in cell wall biosynthesis